MMATVEINGPSCGVPLEEHMGIIGLCKELQKLKSSFTYDGIDEKVDASSEYMDEARQIAAQCWCDKENAGKAMDVDLAESMARRLSGWMTMLAHSYKNMDYYVGLLDKCAEHIGTPAYMADDGTVGDSPIRAKLPELVKQLVHIMMRA